MDDPVAVATFLLALGTFALAFFTFQMAKETQSVAKGTELLAKAAQDQVTAARDQVRIAGEQFAQLRDEAAAAREPQIVLELDTDEVFPQDVPDELGSVNTYYLVAKVRLSNYGGHAFVEQLRVTGKPKVSTRPPDVAGFIPSGGRMAFQLRFEVEKGSKERPVASVPIRVRGQALTEWRESLYFVNVRFVHGANELAGWRAEVTQPLNL